MKTLITLCLAVALVNNAWSVENNKAYWQADSGELKLMFFYDLLNDHNIEVIDGISDRQKDWSENVLTFTVGGIGGLDLYVPYDGLKAVPSGQLQLEGQFKWTGIYGDFQFKNLTIKPVDRPLKSGELTALELVNDKGQVLFYLDHIHAGFDDSKSTVQFNNMDLRISDWLADELDKPYMSDLVIGHAHMVNQISIPTDYKKDMNYIKGGCSAGDNWPDVNNPVDVQLIQMNAQYVRSIGDDHVVFTPSATLKNVGNSDVAWWRKFTGNNPPYTNDQHPYLYWSMYREIDNRFEQIGASGLKHAFFTVNTFCSCSGGQVLFPTCEDTYSVGNNDSPSHLGPRAEISAFSGLWESTGSFFDQVPVGGDGSQDTNSNGTDENRMVVAEANFNDTNLDYFISSWYLIRDDIDIYNSMGYRGYDFTANGNAWLTNSTTSFTNGPASDQYVSPNTLDLSAGMASQRVFQVGEGHLTVAVKVIENIDDTYTYNYMVENHDYDPQVQTITLPLPDSATMQNFVFSDVDENLGNDWTVTHNNNQLILQAAATNGIDWGTLYSFSFTTDSQPQLGQVDLTGLENTGNQFNVDLITPSFIDLIFENSFEVLN